MTSDITLALVIVLLVMVGVLLVLGFSTYRKVLIDAEIDEYERAKAELLDRANGISKEGRETIIETVIHAARNNIGLSFIIEGANPLYVLQETGDEFGVGLLNKNLLMTLVESKYMNRGAILVRKNQIVAYNCKMPIAKNSQIVKEGLGYRHLGAFGTVLQDDTAVVITVSGETGRISMFGHLKGEVVIDLGMVLKEFDIRGGVTQRDLEYRFDSLLTHQGVSSSLESDEVQRAIAIKDESRAERKERKRREKEMRRLQKLEEEKERELLRKRAAYENTERGVVYDPAQDGKHKKNRRKNRGK